MSSTYPNTIYVESLCATCVKIDRGMYQIPALLRFSRLLLIFIVFLISLVLTKSTTIFATLPCLAYPDPWYKINLDFDKHSLPQGVQATFHNEVYFYGRIQNNSTTPLYLLKTSDKADPIGDNTRYLTGELPSTVTPIYKLVSGKAYFYVSASEEDKRVWGTSWNENRGWKEASYPYVDFEGNLMDKMGVKIDDIKEDNRPSSIQPPLPQAFSFTAYFGKNPIQLQGKIVYELNKDYDPKGEAKRDKNCKASGSGTFLTSSPIIIIGVFGLALISLIGVSKFILPKLLKKSH